MVLSTKVGTQTLHFVLGQGKAQTAPRFPMGLHCGEASGRPEHAAFEPMTLAWLRAFLRAA